MIFVNIGLSDQNLLFSRLTTLGTGAYSCVSAMSLAVGLRCLVFYSRSQTVLSAALM